MSEATPPRNGRFRNISALGLAALILGLILGGLAHGSESPWVESALSVLTPIAQIWAGALRLVALPLSLTLLVSGIGAMPSGASLGRWGGTALAVFAGLLLLGLTLSLSAGSLYVTRYGPDPILANQLAAPPPEVADEEGSLLPGSLAEAAVKGDVLTLAIFAALFGAALRSLTEERRRPVLSFFEGAREALIAIVKWLILFLPIGGFALAFGFSAKAGLVVGASLLQYVAYVATLIICFAAILYFLVAFIGGIGIRLFAISSLSAQVTAAGTRSSMASLPAMVESGRQMGLPERANELVLPMATALLKVNRTVTSTSKFFFLMTIFGVALTAPKVLAFGFMVLLLSIGTPGIPRGGPGATLPAYVAAGIPVEGVMLFEPANQLLDIFSTVLNVTANLAAAAIVSRLTLGAGELAWSLS